MCEFDTHIACAVENIEPHSVEHPSFPQSNALIRQLTSHHHQVDHNKGLNGSVGDGTSSISYEIMRLVAQQIGGGTRRIKGQEHCDSAAVAGWDKRLNSPRRKHNTTSIGKTKLVELQEQSPADFTAYLVEERTPLRDKLTPLSDTNTPSHQFSEACFSIDLAKSYSARDRKNQVEKDDGSDEMNPSVVSEKIVSNSGEAKEGSFGVVNWPSNGSYNAAHQNKLNSAIFEGLWESSHKVVMKNSIKDQTTTKSDAVISN